MKIELTLKNKKNNIVFLKMRVLKDPSGFLIQGNNPSMYWCPGQTSTYFKQDDSCYKNYNGIWVDTSTGIAGLWGISGEDYTKVFIKNTKPTNKICGKKCTNSDECTDGNCNRCIAIEGPFSRCYPENSNI